MSADNFGSLGADFFIKTYDKGSTMSQADLDALVQYVQLTTTILAIGPFTADEQQSVWMILERADVASVPDYTVSDNTEVTMTSGGLVTINSLPWSNITGKPTIPDLTGYATEAWVNSQGFGSGGGSTNTGNITFNGDYITGTNGTARLRTLDTSTTASYNFTPGNGDYSTAVWDGTGITFNDPTQAIYDAIWALTDLSTIEVQVAGTWFTVTSAGSSTPGMPQAPTLWLNQSAVDGPLNIDVVDISIIQGTQTFIEVDGRDIEIDANDDLRMYANDTFKLTNRSSDNAIEIETNDGENRWTFRPDGGLDLPDSGDIYRNGTSVIPNLSSVATSGSYNDLNDKPNFLYRQVNIPVTSKGQPNDQLNDIAFDSNYVYYCTANYIDGVANIWKRMAFSVDTWD